MEKKHGLFTLFHFIVLYILSPSVNGQSWNNEVDNFLDDPAAIQDFKSLKGLKNNNYDLIDKIRDQKQKVKTRLEWKEPPKGEPRIFTETKPYTAQLKKGAILKEVDSNKSVKSYRDVIIKARQTYVGSHTVYVLDKDGNEKYTTLTSNAINIENEVVLQPTINQLSVYNEKSNYHSIDGDLKLTTYFGFHVESVKTSYYATIFRGEKQTAQNYTIEGKTYLLTEDSPFNFGLNLQYQYGYWEDIVIGTATWQALLGGPSFMVSFWERKDSKWNAHLNLFKSIFHESQKNPDSHKLSTVGSQIEFEKQMRSSYGTYALGVKYTWMSSSLKESTEYLENVANRGIISSFGAYINYNFDWSI